jgi:hypothetical protein
VGEDHLGKSLSETTNTIFNRVRRAVERRWARTVRGATIFASLFDAAGRVSWFAPSRP